MIYTVIIIIDKITNKMEFTSFDDLKNLLGA
jgi:hypothetical protein